MSVERFGKYITSQSILLSKQWAFSKSHLLKIKREATESCGQGLLDDTN